MANWHAHSSVVYNSVMSFFTLVKCSEQKKAEMGKKATNAQKLHIMDRSWVLLLCSDSFTDSKLFHHTKTNVAKDASAGAQGQLQAVSLKEMFLSPSSYCCGPRLPNVGKPGAP